MYYNSSFKTIDLAPRPSQIHVCEDRDVKRRYPPKIEPAVCSVIWRVRRHTPIPVGENYKLGPPSGIPVKKENQVSFCGFYNYFYLLGFVQFLV